jgi:hypothetical protein
MDSAALATAQAALPHWQRMGILPRCLLLSGALNRTTVEKFRVALGDDSLCVVFDNPVTKDEAGESIVVTSLKGSKIITLNEARARMGYDPVDGGDDTEALTAPPVDPFADPFGGGDKPGEDGEKPKPDKDDDKDGTDDEGGKVKALPRRKSLVEAWFDGGTCCHGETRPRVKKLGERYIQLTERELERMFSNYFDGATARIVDGIGVDGSASVELSRLTDYNARAQAQTLPVFRDLYIHGYNAGGEEVNDHKPGALELLAALNELAASFLDGYQANLYSTVGTAVDSRVRSALSRVIIDGGGIDEMKQAVEAVMQNASAYGAERIARTESARTFGVARMQAWEQSGIVVGREWLLSGNPCPACVELRARRPIVRMGQPFARMGETFGNFTVGFMDVHTDPLHPNCGCYAAAIFDDDPAAAALTRPAQVVPQLAGVA